MCCYRNKEVEQEVMDCFVARKTAVFWKMLQANGCTRIAGFQYKPGVNVAQNVMKRYRLSEPRGLHVYIDKPTSDATDSGSTVLPVTCHRNDLIRAGYAASHKAQAVFRRLTICRKDWEEAGFKRKGSRDEDRVD